MISTRPLSWHSYIFMYVVIAGHSYIRLFIVVKVCSLEVVVVVFFFPSGTAVIGVVIVDVLVDVTVVAILVVSAIVLIVIVRFVVTRINVILLGCYILIIRQVVVVVGLTVGVRIFPKWGFIANP